MLFVVRHADAGDPAEWAGDDADRPLSKKGRRQAKRLASFLAGIGIEADALVTSPKVRAADTAKALAKRLKVTTTVDPRLGFGFDGSSLDDVISGLAPEATSVLLVGHDPDLSGLVSWLVGAPLALRKGALAVIDLPDRSTGPGRGTLRWLLPPDAIPD